MPVIRNISADLDIQKLQELAAVNGNSPISARLEGLLPEILIDINRNKLIVPSMCYEIVAVHKITPGKITLNNGDILEAPLLAHRIARASHILFGVTTIGCAMAKTVRQCFKNGRNVKAVLMEEIANAALFETTNGLHSLAEEQARCMELNASGPLSPGDHEGFGLDQQATVLALAGAESLGITMAQTGQMWPIHSVSFVIGLGKQMQEWKRIDDCRICGSRDKCRHYLRSLEASA